MTMHIICLFGDEGDDALAEMQLRDAHRKELRLSGPCEYDCEVTSPLDDDREENDTFLSRPIDLRSKELRTILAEVDLQAQAAFDEGFLASVDWDTMMQSR